MTPYEKVKEAADFIKNFLGDSFPQPKIGFVLGSGLGAFADSVTDAKTIPYGEIPQYPVSSVTGHEGRLVCGVLDGVPVAVMQGRVHGYEGYSWEEVVRPVRTLGLLGVKVIVLTNAAGGVDPDMAPGTLMLINDHINLTGGNPLIGPNEEKFGARFPDMTTCYKPEVFAALQQAASDEGIDTAKGVYVGQYGPTYETPAEIRMVRVMGGNAVGMSTVPEAIAANHMGLKVGGISCITNHAAGITDQPLTHDEVKETAARVTKTFCALLRASLPHLAKVAQ